MYLVLEGFKYTRTVWSNEVYIYNTNCAIMVYYMKCKDSERANCKCAEVNLESWQLLVKGEQ